jgi:RNA polymerase sigma factor (sigma-70 family)
MSSTGAIMAPPAPDAMAIEHLPLAKDAARWMLRALPSVYHDRDAAYSDALLALARAINTYDPGRDVRFAYYYRRLLRTVVDDAVSRHAAAKRSAATAASLHRFPESGTNADWHDPRAEDPAAVAMARDEAGRIASLASSLLASLTPRQAEAIARVVMGGETLAAAGRAMGGISHEAVRHLVAKGLDRLRAAAGITT